MTLYFAISAGNQLNFYQSLVANICSNPLEFSFNIPKNLQICASCHKEKPLFNKLISIFKYTDNIKSIILNFKYHDKTILAKPFAKLISNKLIDLDTKDFHIVTAVPLHKKTKTENV